MRTISKSLAAFVLSLALISAAATPVQASPDTVYITKSGDKYHAVGCRYLKKSSIPVSRVEAQRMGKSACSVCRP